MTTLAPTPPVLNRYRTLSRLPLGSKAFDVALALFAPFNAVFGIGVETLEPGYARTSVRDRRLRQNHLGTVHAAALAGYCEITGNLALSTVLPQGASFVVRRLSVEYEKKARGTLTIVCSFEPREFVHGDEPELEVMVHDASGARVARASSLVRIRGGGARHG